jgi:hypothetical protein
MYVTRDHHVKSNKTDWEKQYLLSHMWDLVLKNKWQECKTGSVWGNEYHRVKGESEQGGEYGWCTLYTCTKVEDCRNYCKYGGE